MAHKWSRFNLLFISPKYGFFVYNSRTSSFHKISEETYTILRNIANGKENKILELDNKLLTFLLENKIIVNEGDDYLYITKMEYLKRKRSFTSNDLSLIIAPTMSCNFKCPYCYEHDLPSIKMPQDVQNAIVRFINNYHNKCQSVSISWHGGEPLIAFNEVQSLIQKIENESKLPISDHSIITNGFLFDNDVCDFFSNHNLDYIQITVDGEENTHNKNRIHKQGIPTYKRIIENIDNILSKLPNTMVGVRMNIHNENKREYYQHFKNLSNRWKNKNANVYPAFVIPQGGCFSSSCLTPNQKAQFYIDLHRCGMNVDFSPRMQLGTCSALYETSFVIDAHGYLYKCWADVGIANRAVGDVFNGITKWDFVAAYSIGSDKFTDPKCRECNIFPNCDGGCNRFRTEQQLCGSTYNICQIDEKGMQQYLEIMYEQSLTKKQK